jgi:hypothetical protein
MKKASWAHDCCPLSRNSETSYPKLYFPALLLKHTQDIYKYVTHEKGILGSQGDYNVRHRRLCQPPFRNKAQLERFADVVVQR